MVREDLGESVVASRPGPAVMFEKRSPDARVGISRISDSLALFRIKSFDRGQRGELTKGFSSGSNGYNGTRPENSGTWNRSNVVYGDVEVHALTDEWTLGRRCPP